MLTSTRGTYSCADNATCPRKGMTTIKSSSRHLTSWNNRALEITQSRMKSTSINLGRWKSCWMNSYDANVIHNTPLRSGPSTEAEVVYAGRIELYWKHCLKDLPKIQDLGICHCHLLVGCLLHRSKGECLLPFTKRFVFIFEVCRRTCVGSCSFQGHSQ